MEPLEKALLVRLGDAHSSVREDEIHVLAAPAQRHRDPPLEGMLEGVREKVEDDLLPHLRVNMDRRGQAWAVDHQGQPSLLDRRAKHRCELSRVGGQIDGLEAGLDTPCLDAGEVEKGIDQLEKSEAVAMSGLEPLAASLRERALALRQLVLER